MGEGVGVVPTLPANRPRRSTLGVLQGDGGCGDNSVDFQFVFRTARPADLADDIVAEPFFHMDAIIDRGVLAGRRAQEIHGSVIEPSHSASPRMAACSAPTPPPPAAREVL